MSKTSWSVLGTLGASGCLLGGSWVLPGVSWVTAGVLPGGLWCYLGASWLTLVPPGCFWVPPKVSPKVVSVEDPPWISQPSDRAKISLEDHP